MVFVPFVLSHLCPVHRVNTKILVQHFYIFLFFSSLRSSAKFIIKMWKNLCQNFCYLCLRFFPPRRAGKKKKINILATCSWLVLPYLLL